MGYRGRLLNKYPRQPEDIAPTLARASAEARSMRFRVPQSLFLFLGLALLGASNADTLAPARIKQRGVVVFVPVIRKSVH